MKVLICGVLLYVTYICTEYSFNSHYLYSIKVLRLLLKSLKTLFLFKINSISVLASFGNDALSLRDAFVTKLNSETESGKLRIAIIELLKTAVETQPGLVELLLNQQLPKPGNTQVFGVSFCYFLSILL